MAVLRSILDLARLARPLDVPGIPRVPRALALLALAVSWSVPLRLRWSTASEGLGLVVARLTAGGEGSAGALLQRIGEEQGRALRDQLGYGRDPLECARAVALANRLYRIRARVQAVSADEARVITPGCPWSRQEWWGRGPCGAFSRWEVGMVRGLNPAVELSYESKRSRGDERCVGVYRWRETIEEDV